MHFKIYLVTVTFCVHARTHMHAHTRARKHMLRSQVTSSENHFSPSTLGAENQDSGCGICRASSLPSEGSCQPRPFLTSLDFQSRVVATTVMRQQTRGWSKWQHCWAWRSREMDGAWVPRKTLCSWTRASLAKTEKQASICLASCWGSSMCKWKYSSIVIIFKKC